jgi:predicted O-linked N-acetylglucosamine transferase (SPINDLY family)
MKIQNKHAQGDSSSQLNNLINLAEQHRNSGRFNEAEAAFRTILKIKPDFPEAHYNLGYVLEINGRFNEAAESFKRAVELKPNFAEAYNMLGKILDHQNKAEEAMAFYQHALAIKPDYATAHNNIGSIFERQKKFDAAKDCYQRALAIKPDYAVAHYNMGNILVLQDKIAEAVAYIERAIALKPDLAEAHNILGNILEHQNNPEEAVACYQRALAINPDYAEAYYNQGVTLKKLKRYEEALACLDRSIVFKPDMPYASGSMLHLKMFLCKWEEIESDFKKLSEQIDMGKLAAIPFHLVAAPLSPAQQKICAELFIKDIHPQSTNQLWKGEKYSHDRIRIGYFSADFYNHATAHLMAELFELHDRSKFEIIGFSFGPTSNDNVRQRLVQSFDNFFDVQDKSDLEIATLARNLEIDIAIDLKGFTEGARTGIFALRPAPVQVNYLGYPGTMGAEYIDYLIADTIIIPEEYKRYYSEKIIYLPNSYQVNDSSRKISEKTFTRQELGLPEDGFVFCSFNNNYKITPDIFDIWMRLLSKIEGSVLWLFEGNVTSKKNLIAEAEKRGIQGIRLVFAKSMDLANHLARHRLADLFLDTFYCNAHTTASDALWAGLPLLTCLGETFASRVAASLLHAASLPELVTNSPEEYEAAALELATNPQKLSAIRQKLMQNRGTCPLFDTKLFSRHIEEAYTRMWERSQARESADHIYIQH